MLLTPVFSTFEGKEAIFTGSAPMPIHFISHDGRLFVCLFVPSPPLGDVQGLNGKILRSKAVHSALEQNLRSQKHISRDQRQFLGFN